jgi:hypothetical protein
MPNQIKYHSDDQITITANQSNDNVNCDSNNKFVSVTASPTGLNSFKFKGGANVSVNNRPSSHNNQINHNNNNITNLNENHIINNQKLNANNSIIFLGECEMPITKQDGFKSNNKSDYGENLNGNECGKNISSNQDKVDNKTQNLPLGNGYKSSSTSGDWETKNYIAANQIR